MTRRDYVLLAETIRTARETEETAATPALDLGSIDYVSAAIADALKEDNPRFDRDRFLDAAGNDSWRGEN